MSHDWFIRTASKGSGALSITDPHNFIPDLLSPRAVIESKSATLAPPALFVPLPITVLRSCISMEG